ncbi:4-hydroxy-3-methylbut-2-enyl diphosphate reductase [Deinococcus radiopugnans]|uniref:4-hydroxy-3-methylbut-2-enyl diphosphate reductase n=2 Tax=Deinococcus radiopugnans TaxID=57497 RepID=A0A0A7KE40_9DEIO|nr:4-hydroxy-3-methylbut-2-enyl diphosphate reductase [Deinococcus radiopugnans]AIZ44437.1 4-hydroxy-3-methylbut-2-enyl diphosphate reductase [Deinococcus radiopugnans]MBB6018010.1 4-hydroxy-3-methylbut-2-enyl diphosphate reductase [Deinococcus radiopugnans ATCC 19172]TNM68659.1 4-hydroxy-3-methylbut-2-enyl diphosphate reductase [Deinococcus radiopugnans ATCC 19172]
MVERLYLAKPRGFCAGVVMAIGAVERAAQTEDKPVTVYHSIVHNHTVVDRLARDHSVHFVENLDDVEALPGGGDTVVFSAHGISPLVRERARALGLSTIDATCPLVTKVHTEAKKYAREGHTILLIGDSAQHQEVIGTRGEAPDHTILVGVLGKSGEGLHDPHTVTVPDPEKLVVLTQTTLSVDDTRRTVDILKARFPKLIVPPSEDLCYATKNRQDAVKAIAPNVDAFLVLTSTHSSNGMRLLELAAETCGRAERLENADDLAGLDLGGVKAIGITSAASTPDDLVQAVVAHFRALNPGLQVIEEGEWENIEFREPKKILPGQPLPRTMG